MKKIFSFVFVFLAGFSLLACSNSAKPDGNQAIYELAKEKGFEGTYEEWVNSIKGDEVVLVVENSQLKWKYSKEDTYRVLMDLTTLNGSDGEDGLTPYVGEDGFWYVGDECLDVKASAKEVEDISASVVEGKTIFTFTFDDGSMMEAELKPEKNAIREAKLVSKEIDAYKAFAYAPTSKYYDITLDKAEYQLGKYNVKFVEGEDLVPYMSLDEMAKLYNKNLLNANAVSKVEELDGNSVWSITVGNKLETFVKIDPAEQEILIEGSFEEIYKNAVDTSKYSITFENKAETSTIKPENLKKNILTYKDTDFQAVKENGINYYPVSLLNVALQNYTNHKYFYNYTNIYEYNEYENLTNIEMYKTEGAEDNFNVMGEMTKYIEDHYLEKDSSQNPLMPMYVRKNSRSEFTFAFNNFYGLSKVRHISSMKYYFNSYGIYDDMISDNSVVRGKAYSLAAFILQDQHTAKFNLSTTPWCETNGGRGLEPATVSKLVEERTVLDKSLSEYRKSVLTKAGYTEDNMKQAILYSADGTTAYYYFDSFDASENAYDSNGQRKSDDKLATEDSYFFFIKQLNAIKRHTTTVEGADVKVKNVIIDVSQNSGGYVYIMGKLLALMSKDNSATLYYQNDITNEIAKTVYHVDSNKDGVYDDKDCYGNDFNFILLTSFGSFSCGNAFPFIGSQFSHVKTIGVNSGGGECIVGNLVLSNGMNYVMSSQYHLITYNEEKKTIVGVEDGKSVAYTMYYHNFYDMEELLKAVKKLFPTQV